MQNLNIKIYNMKEVLAKIFVEGEYAKFWDSEIYNSSVGLNFRL